MANVATIGLRLLLFIIVLYRLLEFSFIVFPIVLHNIAIAKEEEMPDKEVDQKTVSIPAVHQAWKLYGKGIDHLGRSGAPEEQPLPSYGPDELLIRHDAVGICLTDVKEINYGNDHPLFAGRNLEQEPVVPGHEASITIVAVGENLKGQYRVNQRFTLQPDVKYKGVGVPYGFRMDGAFRQYGAIGKEILSGDEGSYLIPVPDGFTYAEAALTEPWACVEASYRTTYRSSLKPGGSVWMLAGSPCREGYQVKDLWNASSAPARLVLSNIQGPLADDLQKLCTAQGIQVERADAPGILASDQAFDDIFVLDEKSEIVPGVAQHLAKGGVLAILSAPAAGQKIEVDAGRLHYDNILYVGSNSLRLKDAYAQTPVRTELKSQGIAWILGAGGAMGRMHVQRAIQGAANPKVLLATDISPARLKDLEDSFSGLAKKRHIDLVVKNPSDDAKDFEQFIQQVVDQGGFDNITVMVPSAEAFAGVEQWMAKGGVINLFSGLKRGTPAAIEQDALCGPRQVRLIGHSGSGLHDQMDVVEKIKEQRLDPLRSVAAVCGLNQIPDAIQAAIKGSFAGKIVMFPTIQDFPLTGLQDMQTTLPEVYRALENNRFWTAEAEAAFLKSTAQEPSHD